MIEDTRFEHTSDVLLNGQFCEVWACRRCDFTVSVPQSLLTDDRPHMESYVRFRLGGHTGEHADD